MQLRLVNGIEPITDRSDEELSREEWEVEASFAREEAEDFWKRVEAAADGTSSAPGAEPEPEPAWTPPPADETWTPGKEFMPLSKLPEPKIVDQEPNWWPPVGAYRYPPGSRLRESDQWKLEINPETMVPPNSVYQKYFQWATAVTDVPLSHHWAVLSTAIGSMLGPGHRIRHGVDFVTPNLYVIVITDSGARKSYAMNMLMKLLPQQIVTGTIPKSDSALLDMLAESPWRLFALDEAGALFGQLGTSWNASLTHFLIRAYSGDEIAIRARGPGKSVTATVESCSFIGATTHQQLSNLSRNVLEQVLQGGLFGRFFLCPGRPAAEPEEEGGEKKKPVYWKPLPLAADEEFQRWVGNWINGVYVTTPPKDKNDERPEPHIYQLSPEARIELCRWLYQVGPQAPTPLLGPIWARLGLFAKKLGVIYHVAQSRSWDEPINEQTLVCAMRTITFYLIPAYRLLVEQMGNSMFRPVINKVRDYIVNTPGGVRYSDIPGAAGIRREERVDALVALHGDIHYEMWKNDTGDDTGKGGRPFYVVVWGKTPLALDARKNEVRLIDGADADPPDKIDYALAERKEWPDPGVEREPPPRSDGTVDE